MLLGFHKIHTKFPTENMPEDSDSVIDLTQSSDHDSTVTDHNRLHNTVINLDTDDSFHVEALPSLESNNQRRRGVRQRPYSETRATIDPRGPIHDVCTKVDVECTSRSTSTPENRNKRRFKDSKEEFKTIAITEEPLDKKAKPSLASCPICQDEFSGQKLATTNCGHVFCLDCLKRALLRNTRCPICRTYLRGRGYHPLFL